LTCMAEAGRNAAFEEYRLIFDDVESGALMDLKRFFGAAVAGRIEPPAGTRVEPVYSTTIEEFYFHLDDVLESGKPAIYVLDSMDGLSSETERDYFAKHKEAIRKGKEIAGTYGDGKAKLNSMRIRQVLPRIRETGSILIIISQTRDDLGFGPAKRTRSGGRALRFYATIEIWSRVRGVITRTVRGKPRQIGVWVELEVKKNRVSGRNRAVYVPIYYTYGIDDVGACVRWLCEEGYWKSERKIVTAPDFDFKGREADLVRHIEKVDGVERLKMIVQDVWDEIEAACELKRAPRYQ